MDGFFAEIWQTKVAFLADKLYSYHSKGSETAFFERVFALDLWKCFKTMKKIYSLLAVCSLATLGFAQVEIYENGQSTDISGTTYMRSADEAETVFAFLIVRNTSGSTMDVQITRVRLDFPPTWTDGLCWGAEDGSSGVCYAAAQMPTNPWTTPYTATMPSNSTAMITSDIHVNSGGVGTYRYYVNVGGTFVDSVDVQVNSVLSVDEPEVVKGMTAYPNPANGVLTVSATGLEDYQIRMTDVLGKVVYDETASAPKKSIDVSDFKNGVYLVTVLEKGTVVQTRRVVVKH